MAGHAPEIAVPKFPKAKVAIISSSWHLDICNDLIAGARRALEAAEVKKIKVIYVPGSVEIPLAAQKMFEKGYDAVVAVGLVLKGETPHFDYVCQGVTAGIMDVSLSRSKPIGFGVLMCDTIEQANARAGFVGSFEDKGFDSAIAALSVLN